MSSHAETADSIAERLRAAGYSVERTSYPRRAWDRCGERHYVIVTEGDSRAEGQINDQTGVFRFSGYGGPDGSDLMRRVDAAAGFPQRTSSR